MNDEDERFKAMLDQQRQMIEKYGWAANGIFDPDHQENFWTYTSGLSDSMDHPELVLDHLGPRVAHGIITDVVEHIRENGPLEANKVYENFVANGYRVATIELVDTNEGPYPLSIANALHGGPVRAFQLFFPDRNNKFLWEGGEDFGQRMFGVWAGDE